MFPHYFCDQWYQSLADAIKQAQVSELEANKEKVLNDLYQRMETMRNMDKVTESGDAESVGRLWDMASAKLSKTDLTVMKRHAEFLKKHKGLQEIAEQLGRMAGQVNDPDLNRAPAEELQMVEEKATKRRMISSVSMKVTISTSCCQTRPCFGLPRARSRVLQASGRQAFNELSHAR